MSLLAEQTNWILFLGAQDEPAERHILDVVFGIYCLEGRGIDPRTISVFVDGTDRQRIQNLIALGSNFNYDVKHTKDVTSHLSANKYENVVMFVTGHGGAEGIDAPVPIKPFALFQSFREAPNLKKAVIYLGQCYAGTFNYMNVRAEYDEEEKLLVPPLIVVGATSLFTSISTPTQEMFLTAPKPWQANLFLLHLFKWIRNPTDVDGDGRLTVMDSFKYAGLMTNDSYKTVKSNLFVTPFAKLGEMEQVKKAIAARPSDPNLRLKFAAVTKEYEDVLQIQFNHQESWILNSVPAQDLLF